MTVTSISPEDPEPSREEGIWLKLMRGSLSLPYAKVDRTSYLRNQLIPYFDDRTVIEAIATRPAQAGIRPEAIDKLADASIRHHTLAASGASFFAGIPGGFALAATIPTDLLQLQWNAIQLAQKLAYLYGWPDLLENGEVDEETELQITLLFGAMMGSAAAVRGLREVARRFSLEVIRRLPRQALTKTAYYPIDKQVGKWIGISVTKRGIAGGVAKAVPLVGGVVSAGLTAATIRPMGKKLKGHLRELRFAYPDDVADNMAVEV